MNYYNMLNEILDYASVDKYDREDLYWKLMSLRISQVKEIYRDVRECSLSAQEVNEEIFELNF